MNYLLFLRQKWLENKREKMKQNEGQKELVLYFVFVELTYKDRRPPKCN